MHILVYAWMYVLTDIFFLIFFSSAFHILYLISYHIKVKHCTIGVLHYVVLLATTTPASAKIFWSIGSRAYVQALKGNSLHIVIMALFVKQLHIPPHFIILFTLFFLKKIYIKSFTFYITSFTIQIKKY
jgi:hypothetical protein